MTKDQESPARGSKPSRMMADAGYLLAARVVVAVMGWSGTILIVRSLSPTAWGQFAFIFNLMSLMFIVTSAVGPRLALRSLIERSDRERFAGSYIILRALLGSIGYAIAAGFVFLGGYPPVVGRAMLLAGFVIVISATSTAYGIVFQMEQELRRVAAGQVLGQSAQLAMTIILAVIGTSMTIFTAPAVLCEVVILLWTHLQARRLFAIRLAIIPSTWWALLRNALPIAIGQGLFALYANVDSVLLSRFKSFVAVGYYGIAYKFSNLVAMIPIALSVAILGTLIRSWPGEPRVFWDAFRRAFLLMFFVGALICTEFSVFAHPIVQLLYGHQYVEATGAARLVVVGACLSFFTVLATTVFTSQGRNTFYMIAGGIGLVVNVAANLVVIPRWSFQGAAWVTVLTEAVVVAVVMPVCMRNAGTSSFSLKPLLRCLPCIAVAVGCGVGLQQVAPWPVGCAVSTIIFVGMAHALRFPGPGGLPSLVREPTTGSAGTGR